MKKILSKIFGKIIKKAINKSVNDVVSEQEVPVLQDMEPVTLPNDNSKKALWKFIIQTLINILAAVLTALGATSCVSHSF